MQPLAVVAFWFYSFSRKTMNAWENFWNVYCFATNQMQDEVAKDNRQTAGGISHNLIQKNELAHSSTSTKNLQFSLVSLWKSHFYYKPTLVTWICLLKKPNFRIDRVNCKNLQRYRFVSWVKASQLPKKYRSKTTNHSQVAWPFELYVKQTQRNIACGWPIFSRSQTCCLAVSDWLILSSWFNIAFHSYLFNQSQNRERIMSLFENC